MTTEIIVVLSREYSHVRVTRALRPLFLLDTHYFGGLRRYGHVVLPNFTSFNDSVDFIVNNQVANTDQV